MRVYEALLGTNTRHYTLIGATRTFCGRKHHEQLGPPVMMHASEAYTPGVCFSCYRSMAPLASRLSRP